MNAQQFTNFMTTFQDTIQALVTATADKGKSVASSSSATAPKISIKIPIYKRESNENVIV